LQTLVTTEGNHVGTQFVQMKLDPTNDLSRIN
jgi:hypothetical protein